jgi:hypothetical protein
VTRYAKSAARFPRFPSRDEIPNEELPGYDYVVREWIQPHANRPERVDGRPVGVQLYEALAASPAVGAALIRLSEVVCAQEGKIEGVKQSSTRERTP